MKPSKTAMYLRHIANSVGDLKISPDGFARETSFPDVNVKTSQFRDEYLLYNLARKREANEVSPSQVRYSLQKWIDAEYTCNVINTVGSLWSPIYLNDKLRFNEITRFVRANLSRLLCDVWPDFSGLAYTNGATSSTSRLYSLSGSKAGCIELVAPRDGYASFYCSTSQYDFLTLVAENDERLRSLMESGVIKICNLPC